MTLLDATSDGRDFRLLVRLNYSLTLVAAYRVVGLCCAVGLVTAVGIVTAGAWPAPPFGGLELVVLGSAFYVAQRCTRVLDWLVAQSEHLMVTKRIQAGEKCRRFYRHWAQVRLSSRHRWYPSQLWPGPHGRFIEIGAELTEHDRIRTEGQFELPLAALGGLIAIPNRYKIQN